MEQDGHHIDQGSGGAQGAAQCRCSCTGTLNADQRAALVLVDMEGYSLEEAAEILGCAPGTIKSRCARGRARLLPLLIHLKAEADS